MHVVGPGSSAADECIRGGADLDARIGGYDDRRVLVQPHGAAIGTCGRGTRRQCQSILGVCNRAGRADGQRRVAGTTGSCLCGPIWENAAAADLVDGFISADGGDPEAPAAWPGGRSLRDDAIFALWTMVNNGDWCAASFPSASLYVVTWLNLTGLRGPVDLSVWESRLVRACSVGDEDIDEWRFVAAEFVDADGGDSADATRVDDAVDALRLMLRQQVRTGGDASGDSTDVTLVPVHACE